MEKNRKFIGLVLFLILSFGLTASAGARDRLLGVLVEEEDGDPSGYAYKLKVTNGTLDLTSAVGTITIGATAADIESVGDCITGACGDGTSDGGTYYRFYDGDSNYLQWGVENIAANYTLSPPPTIGSAGELMMSDGDNTTSWTNSLVIAFRSSIPESLWRDTDAVGAADTDEDAGSIKYNMSTTTENVEVSDVYQTYFDAGVEAAFFHWDASDWALYLGVGTDAATPGAAIAGYERLKIDFNTATDNEIAVSSDSGADEIDLGSLNLVTTGTLGAGASSLGTITSSGTISGYVNIVNTITATLAMTAAQCLGTMHTNGDNDVIDYTLPSAATGLSCCFYAKGFAQVITVDTYDGTDSIYLEGTTVGAGDAIDSSGGGSDFICLMATDDSSWYTLGKSGTWVDGGVD